ncbi:hypothetical protein U1Q18_034222 [Sarracenia purpurea var. burkii]
MHSPTRRSEKSERTMAASVVSPVASDDDDLYGRLKSLQRQLEFIDIQEEYVKDELKNLKRELLRAQEEVERIQSSLRTNHPGSDRIYGPRNPPVRLRRRSDEGDGTRRRGGVVGPVEEGARLRQIAAVVVELVVRELLVEFLDGERVGNQIQIQEMNTNPDPENRSAADQVAPLKLLETG